MKYLSSLLFLLLLSGCMEPKVSTLPEGEFTIPPSGNFEADVYVQGYADVTTIEEPFCRENCAEDQECAANCKEYDYVYLRITENGNPEFQKFLQQNAGDPFGETQNAVGLGCLENGTIRYENHSDEFDMKEFSLSKEDTDALLAASADAPLTVHLQKLPLSAGRGAPVCYSHFAYAEVM